MVGSLVNWQAVPNLPVSQFTNLPISQFPNLPVFQPSSLPVLKELTIAQIRTHSPAIGNP